MDSLDCKSQGVLYTLFEYPSLTKSKLILIGQSQIVVAFWLVNDSRKWFSLKMHMGLLVISSIAVIVMVYHGVVSWNKTEIAK